MYGLKSISRVLLTIPAGLLLVIAAACGEPAPAAAPAAPAPTEAPGGNGPHRRSRYHGGGRAGAIAHRAGLPRRRRHRRAPLLRRLP